MKSRTNVLIALLCSILIAGTPFGSLGADKIPSPPSITGVAIGNNPQPAPAPAPAPVTPPGNDGLLSGMTPGNYKIPSGWSLVRTQGFEAAPIPTQPGDVPSGESWGVSYGASATTERAHSGSKSLMNTYAHDQATCRWILDQDIIGSLTEVYLSFYEYVESQALFNDEFFLANFYKNTPTFQEVVLDWFWAQGFNQPRATLYAVPQGNYYGRLLQKSDTVPKGSWVQWEIHYRPNTSGSSNGFIRVYKNGTLYTSAENVTLNGTVDMSNMAIQAGGVYTKLVWMTDSPTCSIPSGCSSGPGIGTDYCTSSKGWTGQLFSNPKCNPIDPPLPSFKRYLDDIIVLKK